MREMLANATLLTHPKPDAPTCIITDASDTAVGAVLQQCIADVWCPISFFSRKLKPAETRYSTFDRELLAIYLAIKHFQYFVEGREFHVLTDHKPLIYARDARPDRHSPRQIRHLDFIAQFTADIRHVKGTENSAADALSRIAVSALHPRPAVVVDFRAMAEAQRDDPELRLHRANSSLDLQSVALPSTPVPLVCDVSLGHPRPFVPPAFRRQVFTGFPIQGFELLRSWSRHATFGRTSTGMFGTGPERVCSANVLRSIATPRLHWDLSSLRIPDSTRSTST